MVCGYKEGYMIKSEVEMVYYRFLSVVRRIIKTRLSRFDGFGARFMRAISRRV